MLPELLKAGYLGLITSLAYFSYRVIINLNKSNRPVNHIFIILFLFFSMNVIAGIAGYKWASKELDAASVRQNTASIFNSQIDKLSNEHKESTLPLQKALTDVASELKYTALESNRELHLKEMERINKLIQDRENSFLEKINRLNSTFTEKTDKR